MQKNSPVCVRGLKKQVPGPWGRGEGEREPATCSSRLTLKIRIGSKISLDPLDRAHADPEARRDLDHPRLPGLQRRADRALLLGIDRRAAELLAGGARARPDFTRSWIMARSNSANTPIIWNMALPADVVVSSPCWRG